MKPTYFEEANCEIGPPKDLHESQCSSIFAFRGELKQGSVDGSPVLIVAWLPNEDDIHNLLQGKPVYLTFMGGMPPHCVTTSFQEAVNIA